MRLRCIAAALLLMAFVPASVAAAIPLVLCHGADGHRAIELVQGSPHHFGGRTRLETAKSAESPFVSGTSADCVDYRLLSLAQASQRTADIKPAVSNPLPTPAFTRTASMFVRAFRKAPYRSRPPSPAIDRLASRRTIVLLM